MKSIRFTLRRAAVVFSTLMILTLSFGLTSCKTDDSDETYDLKGTWKETYGTYEITDTTFSNSYSGSTTYSGNNLTVLKTSNSAGYIYIKYTRSMNSDYTYSETAPDVGKWYAIAYKNLTSKSISISGAYKSSGKTSTESLEEAIKEFTIENGYFSYFSDCTK